MKNLTFLLTLMFFTAVTFAQSKKVALHHNGNASFYIGNNAFALAVAASASGDTIYIPGGFWTPASINKRLAIFGAGHYPDSTQATEATHFTSGFTFLAGSDSSIIQGVHVDGDINLSTTSYVTINRCSFGSSLIGATSDHITYSENVLYRIDVANKGDFITIKNNFFFGSGSVYHHSVQSIVQGALIENNVFNHRGVNSGYVTLANVNGSLIRNNIFMSTYTNLIDGSNNLIQNNIFTLTPTIVNNTLQNNYLNVSATNLFVNYTALNNFYYTDDYHLQTPNSYLGTDTTQVGMYGGANPYKLASVPVNPHIRANNSANQTDASGNLNIDIEVGAQDR